MQLPWPRTPLEHSIKAIWEEIINVYHISVTDNFFVVGGNSIHIPQIVHRLNKNYSVNLTIRDFILRSSIKELSLLIENRTITNNLAEEVL